jgi:hypothetical protein
VPWPEAVPADTSTVTAAVADGYAAVSEPFPPVSVSLPSPPVRTSLPLAPFRTFVAVEPVSESFPLPPVAFSVFVMVSVSAPPVFWAVVSERFTVTAAFVPE